MNLHHAFGASESHFPISQAVAELLGIVRAGALAAQQQQAQMLANYAGLQAIHDTGRTINFSGVVPRK